MPQSEQRELAKQYCIALGKTKAGGRNNMETVLLKHARVNPRAHQLLLDMIEVEGVD
jgi:hypothetical protein